MPDVMSEVFNLRHRVEYARKIKDLRPKGVPSKVEG